MKKAIFILIVYCLLPTSIFAQSVDLLWQGDGYLPPFYKGRTPWSYQSRITLLAVPQGLGNSANLNYKWTKNGTVLGDLSGVGKNTLSFNDSVLSRPQTIKVEIVSANKSILTQSSTTVVPISPSALVYENNPLYGFLFHREVSNAYLLKEPEITFTAFPLFFSTKDRLSGSFTYKWQSNTGEVENRSSVTYRAPEGESGTSAISVNISNKNKILQTGSKSFLIQFGNNE